MFGLASDYRLLDVTTSLNLANFAPYHVTFTADVVKNLGFDKDEITRRTGCGLLLDVNNVFVSATNLGFSPEAYIAAFPLDAVGEVHLGGHAPDVDDHGAPLLIDAHGCPVADPVWTLLATTLAQMGPRPVLIEWDNDVPDWPLLAAEAERAAEALKTVQTVEITS